MFETENTLRCLQIAMGMAHLNGCSDEEKEEIKEYLLLFVF